MKFEELTKERQEEVIEEHRDINTDFDWWEFSLDDIAEQVKDKVKVELRGADLMFDFFSKGHSGVWTDRASLFSAFSDKYPNLEDLDISEEFGVWACNGLRKDEIESDDIEFEREEEDEDLADLLREKIEEEDKEKVKEDVDEVLDIFADGYNSLYEEYAYLTSDKGIIETIKDNDMEFEDE